MPPSVNSIFRNVRGRGRVKTAEYIDWRAVAVAAIRRQNPGAISGRVLVNIGVERISKTADIDNRVKAIFDAMVEAGVITDDKYITAFFIAWQPPANGLAHIEVVPVGPVTIKFLPSNDGSTGGCFIAPATEAEMPDGTFDQ
jgi:crossover junction endodeoxyribonuclease RusA